MNIFKQIKSSIYGPEYYRKVVGEMRLRSSIKYLAKFSIIIAMLAVIVAVCFLPWASTKVKSVVESAVSSYPADLEITFKEGKASVNQPEPYMIPVPAEWQDSEITDDSNLKNLVVINTKEAFSIPKFREYATMIWLTETEIVGLKDNNELQIIDTKDLEDIVINKDMVIAKQGWLVDHLPTIFTFIIVVGFFIIFLANFMGTLSALFIYAFAIWGMSAILKKGWGYKKSYQIGIHAITLVSILGLLSVFGLAGLLGSFWVKVVLILLVVYINLCNVSSTPAVEPAPVRDVEATPAQ